MSFMVPLGSRCQDSLSLTGGRAWGLNEVLVPPHSDSAGSSEMIRRHTLPIRKIHRRHPALPPSQEEQLTELWIQNTRKIS